MLLTECLQQQLLPTTPSPLDIHALKGLLLMLSVAVASWTAIKTEGLELASNVAGPGGDEIQAAQAASGSASASRPAGSSSTTAAHVASTTTGAAPAAAGQPPARRIAESDDGKARFVCCSFGGRKAGKKQRK